MTIKEQPSKTRTVTTKDDVQHYNRTLFTLYAPKDVSDYLHEHPEVNKSAAFTAAIRALMKKDQKEGKK